MWLFVVRPFGTLLFLSLLKLCLCELLRREAGVLHLWGKYENLKNILFILKEYSRSLRALMRKGDLDYWSAAEEELRILSLKHNF